MKTKFKSVTLCASFLVVLGAGFTHCTSKSSKKKLTIYTSVYKEVIAIYGVELQKAFPDVDFDWYQAGSENVASRVNAEIQGGGVRADLLMSSDIFFYQELKKQGQLQPIVPNLLEKLPAGFMDADRMYAVNRFPVMIIAVNSRKIAAKDRPKSFKDLIKPEFKDKIAMPSPMESGTALATSLYFSHFFGPDYFSGLRKNNIVAAGGNGATLSRVESGEKPIAIVLMENVLQAREKGTDWIDFIIPEEGALAIPSPIAIFKSSHDAELANRVLAWFASESSSDILTKGWIYSAYPESKPPNGAPKWKDLKMASWDLKSMEQWGLERQKIKDLFQNTVLK